MAPKKVFKAHEKIITKNFRVKNLKTVVGWLKLVMILFRTLMLLLYQMLTVLLTVMIFAKL